MLPQDIAPPARDVFRTTTVRQRTLHGLRAVLCLETSDRHGQETTEACFDEQREFIRRSANSDLKGLVGLHAPFTLSDQTLGRASDLCRELAAGIHIHLAEDAYEQR